MKNVCSQERTLRLLQGNPSEIFDLPELKIFRENYYSGQGPNDSEEGSP
ncbi:hypothetical protein U2F10_06785 [Leptothoe sp. EHU-05/26/07-4]